MNPANDITQGLTLLTFRAEQMESRPTALNSANQQMAQTATACDDAQECRHSKAEMELLRDAQVASFPEETA